jgi:uncharacterized membrane protein
MMHTIGIGVIGMGWMGEVHSRSYRAIPVGSAPGHQWRNDANLAQDGYTTLLSGPDHPYHRHFNPAWGLNLGYDDLKVIEACNFLHSVVTSQQREPTLPKP